MERKNVFLLLLILGTAFWGINFPVTKMTLGNISSSTFVFYRFLGATLILSVVFARQLRGITVASVKKGIILAASLTAGIHLQTLGLKYTSAAQCAFVAGTTVIILPLIKLIFYKASVEGKVWLASLLALAGLFVISVKDNFSVNMGDLYTFLGAFCFAFYLISVEKFSGSNNSFATIIPMFAACTVFSWLLSVTDPTAVWLPDSNAFWMGIAFCAVFSTAYMYTVSNISQQYIPSEKVAVIFLLEPVFAAIAAFFLLHESVTWRLMAGGALIFLATLIPELKFKRLAGALKPQ